MKKIMFVKLLTAVLLLNLLAVPAFADETAESETTEAAEETKPVVSNAKSGDCGEDLTWELKGGTLTITGTGEMDDGAPWVRHKEKIQKLVLSGGVETVGADAFSGCEELEVIEFGDSLREIGERAFQGCKALRTVWMPATFRKFGASCFEGCTGLESVYCDGGMPSFRGNCLWTGAPITVYTPLNNPWPQEAVQELMENFGGRLTVTVASGDNPYQPPEVEETEPQTTEAPTVPETQPATEAPTVPTEAVTEPATEAATEATTIPTTVPETTLAPTEPEVTETNPVRDTAQKVESRGWIGLLCIAGVFTFVIVGALIVKGGKRKGGKYSA